MAIDKEKQQQKTLRHRTQTCIIVFCILFMVLAGQMLHLQVIKYGHYLAISEVQNENKRILQSPR